MDSIYDVYDNNDDVYNENQSGYQIPEDVGRFDNVTMANTGVPLAIAASAVGIYQLNKKPVSKSINNIDEYEKNKKILELYLSSTIVEPKLKYNDLLDKSCMDDKTCIKFINECNDTIDRCVKWFGEIDSTEINNISKSLNSNGKVIRQFIKSLRWPMIIDIMDAYARPIDNINNGNILSILYDIIVLTNNSQPNITLIMKMIKKEPKINFTENDFLESNKQKTLVKLKELEDQYKNQYNISLGVPIYVPVKIYKLKTIIKWANENPEIKKLLINIQFRSISEKIFNLCLLFPEIINTNYIFQKQIIYKNNILDFPYGLYINNNL